MNMTEIARRAGVGKATVSLALRNDPRLKPATRARIQAVAAELGYRPNALVANLMAQLRASKHPKYQATLALLNAADTRDALQTNATFRAWALGIHERATELGYGINEFWMGEPGISPERLSRILRARSIRGVILAGIMDHGRLPSEFDVVWGDISCVVVGVRPECPAFHFACNDQFSTAAHAAKELAALGYRRPGLVIDQRIEENIDHRFSAGFYAGNPLFEERLPAWSFDPAKKHTFVDWLREQQPDVLVCTHSEVRDWVVELGLDIPGDIGVVHLDLIDAGEDWSGMNQNNDLVGKFAVDLLIGQLHRNEVGIPERPKCMMVESQWVPGGTVREKSAAGTEARAVRKKRPGRSATESMKRGGRARK